MAEKQQKEKIRELQEKNEKLQGELRRLKRKPEGKIGYLLLAIGFLFAGLAVDYSHNVSAFLAVALIFWGALFLYIRPTQFIRKEVLDHSVTEPQENMTRLVEELGYQGSPQYVSPGNLWGVNNTVLWIPKNHETDYPTDEQLSSRQVFIADPPGLVLTPPGQGLSRLIEEELKTSFTKVDLDYLAFNLEKALVEGLEVAESFTLETENPLVRVEVRGSIFSDLVQKTLADEKSLRIGDTFNSAIASILARTTRQPVTIESIEIDTENKTMKSAFKIHEAPAILPPEEYNNAAGDDGFDG